MAKRSTEPLKPMFPLKHEFYRTLDEYIERSGMLAGAVGSILPFLEGKTHDILKEKLDAFNEVRFGDE